MQTRIPEPLLNTSAGASADAILRKCVHCGFCTAVCPTYRVLGNELDSPRGRIYLIKALLEGDASGEETRRHLDRCLGCRACETACPSEVDYHHLLDIGKAVLAERAPRPLAGRLARRALLALVPHRRRMALLVGFARRLRPVLPATLAKLVPPAEKAESWPAPRHERRALVLQGCVQEVIAPATNAALARILDRLGTSAQPAAGCCGAVYQHTDAPGVALDVARRNIDDWLSRLGQGDHLVIAATGCAGHVRDYPWLLRDDPVYAARAQALMRQLADPSDLITPDLVTTHMGPAAAREALAFHTPCSMQHGLRAGGRVEELLRCCGYTVQPVPEQGMCCGSAGTYSLLQPGLARTLRDRRLAALGAGGPEVITTANVGCQQFLQSGTDVPVQHSLQAEDRAMTAATGP